MLIKENKRSESGQVIVGDVLVEEGMVSARMIDGSPEGVV